MTRPLRLLIATTLFVAFSAGSIALAQSSDDTNSRATVDKATWNEARDRVIFLLSGYEFFPSQADLDAVGSPEIIVELLQGLARDETMRPTLRVRAVDAMAHYDAPELVAYLAGLVVAEPDAAAPAKARRVTRSLRHHAITALAKIEGESALKRLEPLLTHDDLQIRLTAISALGKHTGPAGRARLEKLRDQDSNLAVQREIAKFLD